MTHAGFLFGLHHLRSTAFLGLGLLAAFQLRKKTQTCTTCTVYFCTFVALRLKVRKETGSLLDPRFVFFLSWMMQNTSINSLQSPRKCCSQPLGFTTNYTLLLELCFALVECSSFVPILALRLGREGLEIVCAVDSLVDGNIWKLKACE